MTDNLPELTEDERQALDDCDMTDILGTWEERYDVAMRAAKRWFRERNELRAKLTAAEALLLEAVGEWQQSDGFLFDELWYERAKEVVG